MLYGVLIKKEAVTNVEVDETFNRNTDLESYKNSVWTEYVDSDLFIDTVRVDSDFGLEEALNDIAINQNLSRYSLKAIRLYDGE